MYCQHCGKQISDQARFCNYCGKPVSSGAAPGGQQSAAPAKKSKAGSTILAIVLVAAIFFGVRYFAEKAQSKDESGPEANVSFDLSNDSAFEQGFKESLPVNSEIQDAMDSCARGALYEDGYLRYGLVKLHMPGYTLLPGEGEDRDWMASPTGGCVVAAYRQPEVINVSFEASDGEGMLSSYQQSYSDAAMEDFQKYEVNGYPVIRYIVRYTTDGMTQYHGELIVFPAETTDETIRIAAFEDVASGYGMAEINQVFDTLQVSHEFRVSAEETNVIGANRITVK